LFLLILLLLLRLLGFDRLMVTNHAARRRAEQRVVREMPGSTADDRSFDAAFALADTGANPTARMHAAAPSALPHRAFMSVATPFSRLDSFV